MKISKETFVSYKKTFWDTLQNKESEIEKKNQGDLCFLKKIILIKKQLVTFCKIKSERWEIFEVSYKKRIFL